MTRRCFSRLFTLLLCLAASLGATPASASHLRGTSVSWVPTGNPGEVKFTIAYSQRASAGCDGNTCAVGGTVSFQFTFGDGASSTVVATLTSLNSAEDYFAAVGTVTHTYSGNGPYTAYYLNSARVSTIVSGHDQNLRMETTVSPRATPVDHSPVSSMPAIVTVALQPTTTFNVIAADQDNDTLTYRLATASEMYSTGAFTCTAQQPPGLSISNSGLVTWDTTQITAAGCSYAAPAVGDLWTVQFMVEDRTSGNVVRSKTPVDIILKFVSNAQPPPTVSFTNPGPITVSPGSPVSFTLNANQTGTNARVTFNVTGLPIGATATNLNQALTPPVSSTFNWTPTQSQAGTYVVTYTVTNDTLQQSLASVTITVPSSPPPVLTCPASLAAQYNTALSIPVQVIDPQGEALTVVWKVDGTTVQTDPVTATASTTNLSSSQTFSTLGAHTVALTATNTDNVSGTCSIPVTVSIADQTISLGSLPAITYGDADVALSGAASSGLPVTLSASGSCSIVGGLVHVIAAGNCSVTATQPGDGVHYNAAPTVTQSIQVAQRPLTVGAQNATRQYGAANPTFSGNLSGVLSGDDVSVAYTTTATLSSPVGTYPIVPALTGIALPNYAAAITNGMLTVTAGAPSQLATSTPPSTLVSGGNAGVLTATIQDAYGNTVTTSTAPVTATITGPNGYSQTVTTAAVNGVATLNLGSLPLNIAGAYTVTTSSAGLTGTSASLNVTPGAASQLAASTVLSTLVAGGNLGSVTSTVKDANGNVVTSSTANVVATITGPNSYSQIVTVAAVNGVATFNLASLPLNAAGTYTLTTTSVGLSGTSATTTVTPGVATQVTTNAVSSTVVSGGNLGTVTATLKDAQGNTVTSSTAAVAATVTGPNGYSQTVAGTAVNGVATLDLSTLALNAAGTYSVSVGSNGLTPASSTTTVTPGSATQLSAGSVAATLVSGGNLGVLTATVKDANGNTVTSSTAAVTATITGPNGYSQTVNGSAVNGVVTLDLSTLPLTAAGNYMVSVSSPGLTGVASGSAVSPASAAALSVGPIPVIVTSGDNLGTVAVAIKDANGNTVTTSNAPVTATITGPNGFSQTVTATAVNGVATLNLSSLPLKTAGPYSVTLGSAGLPASGATVTTKPGAASQLTLATASTSIVSGQGLAPITVTAQDTNGNTAVAYSGPITATLTGPNGYQQTVTGTAANGVLSLDLSTLTPSAAGTYGLAITGSGQLLASTSVTVAAAPQAVVLPTVPTPVYGTGATGYPVTSSAGLPIVYTVSGPAVMNGSNLVITGAGTVTVTATQPGDAAHSPVVVTSTIQVAPASTTTTLTTSSSVATLGTPVLLTAQVTSTAGAPTGTVTFKNGGTVVGTAQVSPTGKATLSVSTLPTGALNLTASYGGDANFVASASVVMSGQVEDFGIAPTAGTPSASIVPGETASYTLALTPATGAFSSPITLSVSGLPTGATYTFSKGTLTPGSAAANTVLTIQTPKPLAMARRIGGAAGIAFATLLLPFGFSRKARTALKGSRVLSVLGLLLLLGGTAGLTTGCATGNGFFGQASQSYTVTVTATSGTLAHSTQVVLNVQ